MNITQFADLDDLEYAESIRRRARDGTLPAGVEELLWYLAYGLPRTFGRTETAVRPPTQARRFALSVLEDPDYVESVRRRARNGTLPAGVEELLWYLAYGLPPTFGKRVTATAVRPPTQARRVVTARIVPAHPRIVPPLPPPPAAEAEEDLV